MWGLAESGGFNVIIRGLFRFGAESNIGARVILNKVG